MEQVGKFREERLGMVFTHPKFGEYEIVRYGGCMDVDVRFRNTANILNTQYVRAVSGEVRDCMQPTMCGVGVVGHSVTKKSGVVIKSYATWKNMLVRCYDEKVQERCPTYIGCSVCEGWLYYPNFKSWYDVHYIEGCELDKDIRVKGNKIYSPETCMFISKYENTLESHRHRMYSVLLLSPEGQEVRVSNQTKFCKDMGLNKSSLWGVISGNIPHHRGWKFIRRLDDK